MPIALITGIAGQDGSYLAEFLIEKGYRIVGTVPNVSSTDFSRLRNIHNRIEIVEDDLLDQDRLQETIADLKPDEIYNLASHSFLAASFTFPVQSGDTTALGVTRLLESIRKTSPSSRLFQASSSEIFGNPAEVPQSESTPFRPRNPYGVAKVYAHLITINYREAHKLFACCGILYNHESPRRGPEFVTRKITQGAAMIKLGLAKNLELGNLESRRDWGFAGDYIQAMWLMLQQSSPDDYVIATGKTHSVREFCEIAFSHVGLNYQDYVVQNPDLSRPSETAQLVGNPGKAQRVLNWKPTILFPEFVRMMVDADLSRFKENSGKDGTPR